MDEKRSRKFWKLNFTLRFLNVSLVCVTALTLISFYALSKLMTESQYSLLWRVNFVILQLSFTGVVFSFIVGMFLLLHRTLGAIPRIEKILEDVINGNYSLRITVRKKDTIRSLVDKLNQILDLLEKKGKN